MKSLNPMSETVLKYITDSVPLDEKISLKEIASHFNYSKNEICATLLELHDCDYIRMHYCDDFSVCDVFSTHTGVLYFANKKAEQVQSQTTNINIHNSQGINVGNNNTSNININTVDFNEIYKIIDDLNEEHRDEMREIVDTLKDCIENSKPLPKGKFQTMLEVTSQMSTIFCNIGQLIFEHLTQ